MSYNLTDNQKDLLRWIVQQVRDGNLPEEFLVAWVMGGRGYLIFEYRGEEDDLPDITPGLLDALAAADVLLSDPNYELSSSGRPYESTRRCVLTGKTYDAVDNDFESPPTHTTSHVTVGAIIQTMSGGNVQAVGIAQDTEISQVINDPDLLRSQVEALTENLLDEVKSALKTDDLAEYVLAIQDFREQLLAVEPDPSLIKRLACTLGLLGDIEGTIGLMTRVWSFLHPLLLIAAARLG
jgi:hypothetical protein